MRLMIFLPFNVVITNKTDVVNIIIIVSVIVFTSIINAFVIIIVFITLIFTIIIYYCFTNGKLHLKPFFIICFYAGRQ